MARTIQQDEIRAGDKIRIIEEVTVIEYFGDGHFTFAEDPDLPGYPRTFVLAPNAEIQLIDRPTTLPVETGSIVRIVNARLGMRSSTWVLFDEGGRAMWISAGGSRMAPQSFSHWIKAHMHSVEVIT